jgi:hypothetical protein
MFCGVRLTGRYGIIEHIEMAKNEQTPPDDLGLVPLDVVRSDFRYEATLAPPAFDMLLGGKSFGPVYNALEPLGLRLEDMRVEGQQPAEQALACYLYLLGSRTLVRYRFDRVEVHGIANEVGVNTLFDLIEVAMGVVRSTTQAKIDGHSFTTGVHGRLRVGTVEDHLARHVSATKTDNLTMAPAAVTFRVASDSASGVVTLERSLSVVDAAFIQVVSAHATNVHERVACDQALAFFRAATAALGLRVNEERTDAGT